MESGLQDILIFLICIFLLGMLCTLKRIDTSLEKIADSIGNNTIVEEKEKI